MRRFAPKTLRNSRKSADHFARWAAANGQQVERVTEQDVLRWLHAHRGSWNHATMRTHVDGLRRSLVEAGRPDPTGVRLRDYLTGIARTTGKPTRRVQAIELAALAEAACQDLVSQRPGERLLELRGVATLMLSHATGLPLVRLASVSTRSVLVDDTGLTFEVPAFRARGEVDLTPGRRIGISRRSSGTCPVAVVEELLNLLPTECDRLLGVTLSEAQRGARPQPVAEAVVAPGPLAGKLRVQLARTAQRAGMPAHTTGDLTALTAADLAWLAAHMNPSLARQMRDLTYALLGFALARRHDELANLRVGQVISCADGYEIRLGTTKTDANGTGSTLHLQHEGEPSAKGCPAYCPACQMGRWLRFSARCWGAAPGDLLLPAMRSGQQPTGRLSDWDGTLLLRRLLGRDDVSTRTMRASTVTALRAEGHDLAQIAEVTQHRSLAQLTRYLRLVDPHAGQWHLPV